MYIRSFSKIETIIVVSGQLYGLEKFWAFMRYYKHADKLHVEPVLEEYLSKFRSIEDFRVVEVSAQCFI